MLKEFKIFSNGLFMRIMKDCYISESSRERMEAVKFPEAESVIGDAMSRIAVSWEEKFFGIFQESEKKIFGSENELRTFTLTLCGRLFRETSLENFLCVGAFLIALMKTFCMNKNCYTIQWISSETLSDTCGNKLRKMKEPEIYMNTIWRACTSLNKALEKNEVDGKVGTEAFPQELMKKVDKLLDDCEKYAKGLESISPDKQDAAIASKMNENFFWETLGTSNVVRNSTECELKTNRHQRFPTVETSVEKCSIFQENECRHCHSFCCDKFFFKLDLYVNEADYRVPESAFSDK